MVAWERRAHPRHPCGRPTTLQPLGAGGLVVYSARLEDVSVGGVGLLAGAPVPAPGGVEVALPGLARPVRAQVVHVTPHGGGWRVGCALDEPLTDDELGAVLRACAVAGP